MVAFEDSSNPSERIVSLDSVPDWHEHPCSLMTPLGAKLSHVEVVERSEEVPLPLAVEAIKKQLEPHEKPGVFFDGPLHGVVGIEMRPQGTVRIETKKTSNFAFTAAAYAFKDNESRNPVRPLGIQATVFSPDKKKILLEKRLHSQDHGGTRTTFGGALKLGETDIEKTLANRIAGKSKHEDEWYIPDLSEEQITPTGIIRDNILNACNAAYMITLTKEQYERARDFAKIDSAKGDSGTRERYYFELDVDTIDEKLDSLWRWEPSTLANILYALVASGNRAPEEAQAIFTKAEEKLKERPMTYTYPAERILGSEVGAQE